MTKSHSCGAISGVVVTSAIFLLAVVGINQLIYSYSPRIVLAPQAKLKELVEPVIITNDGLSFKARAEIALRSVWLWQVSVTQVKTELVYFPLSGPVVAPSILSVDVLSDDNSGPFICKSEGGECACDGSENSVELCWIFSTNKFETIIHGVTGGGPLDRIVQVLLPLEIKSNSALAAAAAQDCETLSQLTFFIQFSHMRLTFWLGKERQQFPQNAILEVPC